MRRKIMLVVFILTALVTAGCTNKGNSAIETEKQETVSVQKTDNSSESVEESNQEQETTAYEDPSEEEMTRDNMEERGPVTEVEDLSEGFVAKLEETGLEIVSVFQTSLDNQVGDDLVACLTDADGNKTVWFISGDLETVAPFSETTLENVEFGTFYTESGSRLFINYNNTVGNNSAFEIWRFYEGPRLEGKGRGKVYNNDNQSGILIRIDDYDSMRTADGTMMGRTSKYAVIDTDDFVEYAAIQIPEKQFLALENASVLKAELTSKRKEEGAVRVDFIYWNRAYSNIAVQTISTMENGDVYYHYSSVFCSNDVLDLTSREDYEGIVRSAYTSFPRVYPPQEMENDGINGNRLEGSFHDNLISHGEVFPDSENKKITWEELYSLYKDPVEERDKLIAMARAEIFARHGYSFPEEPWFHTFFRQTGWYDLTISDRSEITAALSEIEEENLDFLEQEMKGAGWQPAAWADTNDRQNGARLDELVGIAREEHLTGSDNYNSYDVIYQVPVILIDSEDAAAYNQMLKDQIYPYIDDSMNSASNGMYPWLESVDYRAYVYQNTLTVVTCLRGDWGIDLYFPITLELGTGRKLDRDEVSAFLGMDSQKTEENIANTMGTYFKNAYKGAGEESEFFKEQYERTIDPENVAKAVLYPSADGTPFIACTIYSLAGAESYDYCIPLIFEENF